MEWLVMTLGICTLVACVGARALGKGRPGALAAVGSCAGGTHTNSSVRASSALRRPSRPLSWAARLDPERASQAARSAAVGETPSRNRVGRGLEAYVSGTGQARYNDQVDEWLFIVDFDRDGFPTLVRTGSFGGMTSAPLGNIVLRGLFAAGLEQAVVSSINDPSSPCGSWEGETVAGTGPRRYCARWMTVAAECAWPSRVVLTVADVSSLWSVMEFGHARERHYRTLVENCPDPIIRFDREGRRLYANPAHASATGIPVMVGEGKTPRELGVFDEQTCARFERRLERVFQTGEPTELTVDCDPRGKGRLFAIRMVAETGEDGQTQSVLAIARDVTGYRRV
ncbi:PAS domain-containing protein [Paraburkholderia sp. BR14263]|uniref:PAS domain-containing protein n=1 Tax=unclassified Paraburkholderia TaxID=2615204 RepID=UPI0034CF7538